MEPRPSTALVNVPQKPDRRSLGLSHPKSLPTLPHSLFIWGAHALHSTNKWCRVCLLPQLHHQHSQTPTSPRSSIRSSGNFAAFSDNPGSKPHSIPRGTSLLRCSGFLSRSASERQKRQYNPIAHRLKTRGIPRPVHNALGCFESRMFGETVRQGWICWLISACRA